MVCSSFACHFRLCKFLYSNQCLVYCKMCGKSIDFTCLVQSYHFPVVAKVHTRTERVVGSLETMPMHSLAEELSGNTAIPKLFPPCL